MAESNATRQSARLHKEMKDTAEKIEIPSFESVDEYTDTPCPLSKCSSRLLVSLYHVAWGPC